MMKTPKKKATKSQKSPLKLTVKAMRTLDQAELKSVVGAGGSPQTGGCFSTSLCSY